MTQTKRNIWIYLNMQQNFKTYFELAIAFPSKAVLIQASHPIIYGLDTLPIHSYWACRLTMKCWLAIRPEPDYYFVVFCCNY